MKVNKNQWVRLESGVIFQSEFDGDSNFAVAVKDTPQELVQVGDLVKFKNNSDDKFYKGIITNIEYGYVNVQFASFMPKKITAIYTPNSDRTAYTLQWKGSDS
jgi:hypothetical protein